MTRSRPTGPSQCPNCQSTWVANSSSCWLCGHEFIAAGPASQPSPIGQTDPKRPTTRDEPTSAINPFQAPAKDPDWYSPTFGLTSILLFVTLAAVVLAVFAAVPGLGILLAFLSVPPLMRTWRVLEKRSERGVQDSVWLKIALFIGSFWLICLVATVVGIASIGTFFAICLAGGASDGIIPIASLAAFATTAVAILCLRKLIQLRWARDTLQSRKD